MEKECEEETDEGRRDLNAKGGLIGTVRVILPYHTYG